VQLDAVKAGGDHVFGGLHDPGFDGNDVRLSHR